VQAALLQVDRIVKARNFNETKKQKLLESIINCTEEPQLMVFGNTRVNVLLLNLEIDNIK
jgi:K+-transporting ATPase ATPase C chain